MNKLTVGSLFSGIGGFDLGLYWTGGFETIWMVEIDEFCQKVLRKHAPIYWPNAKFYKDIKDVSKENLISPDVIVGGFPCQPFSQAGKQRGKEDDRYLWPEMLRIISELKPRWIIGENVAGFINMELENAFADLEAEGYKVEAFVLPACAIEARHRRDRVWILAYSNEVRFSWSKDKNIIRKLEYGFERILPEKRFSFNPGNIGRFNGVSAKLDTNRLAALGNSVVPQIPEILGRMILEIENVASLPTNAL